MCPMLIEEGEVMLQTYVLRTKPTVTHIMQRCSLEAVKNHIFQGKLVRFETSSFEISIV